MKKVLYLVAVLFTGALTLMSCDKNDNEGEGEGPLDEDVKTATVDSRAYNKWIYFKFSDGSTVEHEIEPIGGTYNGALNYSLSLPSGTTNEGSSENQKLEISRVDENTVKITLKDFKSGNQSMGDIETEATVSVAKSKWTVKAENKIVGSYTISCDGTIESNTNINLHMTIAVTKMVAMGMSPIEATYQGAMEQSANVDESTFDWDIAFHSYDKKTNGGSVLATTEKEIADVTTIPTGDYIQDIKSDSLIVNMGGMMDENIGIGYAQGSVNEVLSAATLRDLSNMPPLYSKTDLVYIVKTKSGEYAKIKFTDYMDEEGNKGVFTFKYVYPVK